MANVLFENFAVSTIADVGGIGSGDTTVNVQAGDGALFPSISGGNYFYCVLVDTSANREVVKVTARSTDTFTISRGEDGTTPRAFAEDDKIELRLTAGALEGLRDMTDGLRGNELFLDADADTSITADTDDQIDIKIGGSDKVKIDTNGLYVDNEKVSVLLDDSDESLSGVSSVTFTGLTAGKRYRLEMEIVGASDASGVRMRFGNSGGIDTGSNYNWAGLYLASSTTGAGTDSIRLNPGSTFAYNYMIFTVEFSTEPGDDTVAKVIATLTGATYANGQVGGSYDGASTIDRVQIYTAAGSFSGRARLYRTN